MPAYTVWRRLTMRQRRREVCGVWHDAHDLVLERGLLLRGERP